MIVIRSLVFNVLLYAWIVVNLLLLLPWRLPLTRLSMQNGVRIWARGCLAMLGATAHLRYEIRGREHMPSGPAIIAAKHQSMWDTIVFHALFPDPIYIQKKELMQLPIWGVLATKAGMISIDRAGGASALKAMLRAGRAAIERGSSIIIFPEGTRRPVDAPPDYHPGVVAIYNEAGASVVPVALNSGLFWPRRKFLRRPGVVTIEFLPHIPPGLKRGEFMAALQGAIEPATDRLVAEARERFPYLR